MNNWHERNIAAMQQALNTALFHQSCLDSDCPESIHKEHARHVASRRRALNKAIKESRV